MKSILIGKKYMKYAVSVSIVLIICLVGYIVYNVRNICNLQLIGVEQFKNILRVTGDRTMNKLRIGQNPNNIKNKSNS